MLLYLIFVKPVPLSYEFYKLEVKLPEVNREFPNVAIFLTVDLHTVSIEYTLVLIHCTCIMSCS